VLRKFIVAVPVVLCTALGALAFGLAWCLFEVATRLAKDGQPNPMGDW
jgi:hypothetical protein